MLLDFIHFLKGTKPRSVVSNYAFAELLYKLIIMDFIIPCNTMNYKTILMHVCMLLNFYMLSKLEQALLPFEM